MSGLCTREAKQPHYQSSRPHNWEKTKKNWDDIKTLSKGEGSAEASSAVLLGLINTAALFQEYLLPYIL